MSWLMEHYQELLGVAFAALTVASAVTKLTPTPKDDEVVKKLLGWLSFLNPKGVAGLKLPMSAPKASPFQNLKD